MKADGIKLYTGGVRLAAAAVASVALSSSALAIENISGNYSQFIGNYSAPISTVLEVNSSEITFLLSIIAFCQIFDLLKTLYGWFFNDHD